MVYNPIYYKKYWRAKGRYYLELRRRRYANDEGYRNAIKKSSTLSVVTDRFIKWGIGQYLDYIRKKGGKR